METVTRNTYLPTIPRWATVLYRVEVQQLSRRITTASAASDEAGDVRSQLLQWCDAGESGFGARNGLSVRDIVAIWGSQNEL
jgi:hypothetical protein